MTNQNVDFSLKEISPCIGAKSATSDGGITTGTDLVEINNFIFVKIIRAKNFPIHHGRNNCIPYVVVKIGRFTGTASCLQNTSDLEWNQVFVCEKRQIDIEDTTLEIIVKDTFRGFDDYMGCTSFTISDIPTRFPTDSALAPQWYGFEDRHKRRCRGELMLSTWIGNQADEAFLEASHLNESSMDIYNIVNTRSQIYLMPRIWCLRVNLIEAQNLVLEDRIENSSDFFIRGTVGNLTFTSKLVKYNNGNPIWNEDMFFAVTEPFDQQLVLSVEEVTITSQKRLGICVFPVKNANMRVDESPPLTKITGVKQQNGVIACRLSLNMSLVGGYHIFDEDPLCSSDLNPTSSSLWRPSIGVFELGILNATGLPAMKGGNHTDAYCVAKYGSKWVRTRTVINSLSPYWNEQYYWDVYDPCTFISVSVFDNGQLQEGNIVVRAIDRRIGKVRIRLSEMETNKIYSYSYPLVLLQATGLKKMGEIQLTFRFSCLNMINLCKVYTLPMLPRLHFADPLPLTQLHALRKQIVMLIMEKMCDAEPPLRREVVDYMLDSRESLWSMRRGRADFERINIFMSEMVSLSTQFNDICKWKNPISTFIVYLILFIVLLHPQHLLPAMFSFLILNVLLQLRKKPRQLSHVDLQMSQVHKTSIDELEEEFDPFPSKFADNIIRHRYDQLRITAGKYVTLIGDFATKGERLESLLSWQDPLATMLVMIMCLITGILTLIVPFQVIVFVWFIYLLRHPILRSPFPSLYENWVRRMPSRLDSMI